MNKVIFINKYIQKQGGTNMSSSNICEKVSDIKSKYHISGAHVDPIKIAIQNNIKVVERANLMVGDKAVSGALIKKDDEITIYVEAKENSRRKRFTIAHELGHYFLHLDNQKRFVDLTRNNAKSLHELQADEFAGCLLMDEDEVRNRFEKAKSIGVDNKTTIDILASIFLVSHSAMYIRLKKMGLIKNE